jgi:toxin secretion/phage lysis holin
MEVLRAIFKKYLLFSSLREGEMATILGVIGSIIASWFGGFDMGMETLLWFMAIDYITGLILAGVFKKSGKSKNGALSSSAGWAGLFRKVMTLVVVMVAVRIDMLLGSNYVRDCVIIAFTVNEAISIIENCGTMGVPIPQVLLKAIDVLKDKGEKDETDS